VQQKKKSNKEERKQNKIKISRLKKLPRAPAEEGKS